MYWHDIDIIIIKYWLVFKDKYWVTSKTHGEKFAVTPFISGHTRRSAGSILHTEVQEEVRDDPPLQTNIKTWDVGTNFVFLNIEA